MILIRYFVRGVQERHRLILALQHEKDLLERAYAELTHSHQRLQLLQDELVESRKLASLGMMVAGVAHELNTPTGGALMTISTLQTQLANLATAVTQGMTRSQLEGYLQHTDEGLKLAASNLQHAADLINSFKRLAIDRSQEQVVHFNLADPIHDLANSLRPRLKQTSITLKTVLPERIEMQGYPGILSQVLQNLVDNALNHAFTPNQPGSIVITAVFTGAADTVILSVSDNGQGIEPDLRDTLFDPFVSSGRSRG
ncbi:MAG: HAMP domain-containing histidine kinase, partial [Candidatus Competibacteraceae bacterium]|nr:HAMP domain-containing histidine kinase [Candidatus Competibacteraceae bacterium]